MRDGNHNLKISLKGFEYKHEKKSISGSKLTVTDENGKILHEGEFKSFTANFMKLLYGNMIGSGTVTATDLNGDSADIDVYPNVKMNFADGSGKQKFGIGVGSGTGAVSNSDNDLTWVSDLSYNNVVVGTPAIDGTTVKLDITREISNVSGSTKTLSEAGLICGSEDDTDENILIARDLVAVNLASGTKSTWTYSITVDFDNTTGGFVRNFLDSFIIDWGEVLADGHSQWSGRRGHQCVVFDSKMWIIGGNDGSYLNDVYSSTAGAWTATGTIADADTYDFKAVDSGNTSAYDQVDDVVVESGVEIFIVDGAKNIKEMDLEDYSLTYKTSGAYTTTNGVAVDSDNYYFTDDSRHVVRCYDKATNTLQWTSGTYGTAGSGNDFYNYPAGIDCYGDYLFVADRGNKRIKKIRKSDGVYVSQISLGATISPYSIRIDQNNGDMYVSYYNSSGAVRAIMKVTQAGTETIIKTGLVTQLYDFGYDNGYIYASFSSYHISKIDVSDGSVEWDVDFSYWAGTYNWQPMAVNLLSDSQVLTFVYKLGTGTRAVVLAISDGDIDAYSPTSITGTDVKHSGKKR